LSDQHACRELISTQQRMASFHTQTQSFATHLFTIWRRQVVIHIMTVSNWTADRKIYKFITTALTLAIINGYHH
jgi:hypothetical protein